MSTKCEICGKRIESKEVDLYFDKPYKDFVMAITVYQRMYIAGQDNKEPKFKKSSCEVASDICEGCVLEMFKKVLKNKDTKSK